MPWIYWSNLSDSKFRAGCLAKRIEEDWWLYTNHQPQQIEVFETRKKKFGVRFKHQEAVKEKYPDIDKEIAKLDREIAERMKKTFPEFTANLTIEEMVNLVVEEE